MCNKYQFLEICQLPKWREKILILIWLHAGCDACTQTTEPSAKQSSLKQTGLKPNTSRVERPLLYYIVCHHTELWYDRQSQFAYWQGAITCKAIDIHSDFITNDQAYHLMPPNSNITVAFHSPNMFGDNLTTAPLVEDVDTWG